MTKESDPLFEIISRSAARKKQRKRTLFHRDRPEHPPESESAPPQLAEPLPRPVPTMGAAETRQGRIWQWFTDPLQLPVCRLHLLTALLVMVLLACGAYYGGRRYQASVEQARMQDLNAQARALDAVRAQPPNYNLIDSSVAGVSDRPDGRSVPPPPPAGKGSADPRVAGLNYFRLMELPASRRSEGERAIAFLKTHRVEAALIAIGSGRTLKLIALPGFAQPTSDPRATTLRNALLLRGREWKARHGGYTDWHDLYPEKHQPGRT